MKKFFLKMLEAVVGFPPAIARTCRNLGTAFVVAANQFTPSVHCNTITKFTGVAIAVRYSLGKSDGTPNGVVVCAAGDRAMFVIKDTTSTTQDLSLLNPTPVACIMLGVTNETVPMIAAGAIAVGSVVYPVANGQVNTYVGLGSSGSNFACGIVVASPSNQAGDFLEVMPLLEMQVSTV